MLRSYNTSFGKFFSSFVHSQRQIVKWTPVKQSHFGGRNDQVQMTLHAQEFLLSLPSEEINVGAFSQCELKLSLVQQSINQYPTCLDVV